MDNLAFFKQPTLTIKQVLDLFALIPGIKGTNQAQKYATAISRPTRGNVSNFLSALMNDLRKVGFQPALSKQHLCAIILSVLPAALRQEVALRQSGQEWECNVDLINWIGRKYNNFEDVAFQSGGKRTATQANFSPGSRTAQARDPSAPGTSGTYQMQQQQQRNQQQQHSATSFKDLTVPGVSGTSVSLRGRVFKVHQALNDADVQFHNQHSACYDCHEEGQRAGAAACTKKHAKYSNPEYQKYMASKRKPKNK